MASDTGGVKPMHLGTRLTRERERLVGMTDRERAYRRQWLLDQRLAPHEPVHVVEHERLMTNPFKRLFRMPLDVIMSPLKPLLRTNFDAARVMTGKLCSLIILIYAGTYYMKYNSNDWTRRGGWRMHVSRAAVLPGDANYPERPLKTKPSDYAERGFYKSPL